MSNTRIFSANREFIFPVFKFIEKKYADSMMEDGAVRLSNASIYRNGDFGGLIDDKREGQLSIFQPESSGHNHHEISIERAYMYCTARNFLSDSLQWAMNDKKDVCVLITDVEEFERRLSAEFSDLNFFGMQPCFYFGREIQSPPHPECLSTHYLESPCDAIWVKPVEFHNQREFRMVWFDESNTADETIDRKVHIQDLLIPIHYDGVDVLFTSGEHKVGTKIITKNGDNDALFYGHYPSDIFNPVIRKIGENYLLGFLCVRGKVEGGVFIGGQLPLSASEYGPVVCSVNLEDIERIEYFVVS